MEKASVSENAAFPTRQLLVDKSFNAPVTNVWSEFESVFQTFAKTKSLKRREEI